MTEIYINNIKTDTIEDLPMSLNYAIADILQPDKRNTSFSKTIKFPGTKTNNKLFGHIFNISKEIAGDGLSNFTPDFNPNLKADIKIFEDNILQFSGVVQLLQINRIEETYEYETACFVSLKNIILGMGDKKLEDLDLSEYDHTFNRIRMKESWDTKIQRNGSDYVNFSSGNPTGEGYVYPTIDYGHGQSPTSIKVERSFPAIYVREYINKIFEYSGFTWTSSFFDSTFFKRLIIPFNKQNSLLSDAEKTRRSFLAKTKTEVNTFGTNPPSGNNVYKYRVLFNNDSTDGAFDNTNQYLPGPDFTLDSMAYSSSSPTYSNMQGVFVVKKAGTYDLFTEINFQASFFDSFGGSPVSVESILRISILKGSITGTGTEVASTGNIQRTATVNGFNGIIKAPNLNLSAGEFLYVQIYFYSTNAYLSGGIPTTPFTQMTLAEGALVYNNPISAPLLVGDTMFINSAIPKDILMKDFFMSIVKMFNLYVQPDSADENNLIIEPLVDFYSDNSVIDWSDKVDYSKQITIKPCSAIEGKDYIFKYKPDNDYYNSDYRLNNGIDYGERDITINNDFVNGKKTFELIFSPTPSYGVNGNSMVIPRIISVDNNTGNVTPYNSNIRILYYGGVKAVNGTWNWYDSSSNSLEYLYAYAGHLDDPYTPTLDLLFDIPRQLYWGSPSNIGSNYTDNNLFNKYYYQFISEITDPNSKIITASLRLRPSDIFTLDFKNFIHIDGINYRLNKIIDYDPGKEESFKVELTKIKAGSAFVPSVIDIDGTQNDPTQFDLLEGGEDEVTSLVDTDNIDKVEGGLNAVINLGSVVSIDLINGSID